LTSKLKEREAAHAVAQTRDLARQGQGAHEGKRQHQAILPDMLEHTGSQSRQSSGWTGQLQTLYPRPLIMADSGRVHVKANGNTARTSGTALKGNHNTPRVTRLKRLNARQIISRYSPYLRCTNLLLAWRPLLGLSFIVPFYYNTFLLIDSLVPGLEGIRVMKNVFNVDLKLARPRMESV
jgi:hypothetical protein